MNVKNILIDGGRALTLAHAQRKSKTASWKPFAKFQRNLQKIEISNKPCLQSIMKRVIALNPINFC